MKRLALCVSLLVAVAAQGGIEPRFSVAFGFPDGHAAVNFRLRLAAGSLIPGATFTQHFTMYDIPNLVPGVSTQPADWVATFQARGVDADEIAMNGKDDAGKLLNVTWTWVGTTRIDAPAELGVFGIEQSALGTTIQTRFVAQVSSTPPSTAPLALLGYIRGVLGTASLGVPSGLHDHHEKERAADAVQRQEQPVDREPKIQHLCVRHVVEIVV